MDYLLGVLCGMEYVTGIGPGGEILGAELEYLDRSKTWGRGVICRVPVSNVSGRSALVWI